MFATILRKGKDLSKLNIYCKDLSELVEIAYKKFMGNFFYCQKGLIMSDKSYFMHTAAKTKKINVSPRIMRGGIRL